MTHSHHPPGHPHHPPKRKIHWLWIIGVGLMLLAMLGYVMSMDESLQPEMATPPVAVEAGP